MISLKEQKNKYIGSIQREPKETTKEKKGATEAGSKVTKTTPLLLVSKAMFGKQD